MIRELIRVRADGSDPYHNLAVEEYLTMHAAPGQCILFLWQNQRTVVIGKNQNAWKECDVRKLEEDGGHLVRRLSGGGAVYHDLGNLNFTFCTVREDYDVSRQTDVILQAVRSLGIDAVKNGRNDLTADGRKFSGHAFLKKESHCYHHGTLMVEVNGSVLAKYLRPDPLKLAGKGVDSVRSRVVNLHELKPDLTIDQLADALTDSFAAVYGLPVRDVSEAELTAQEEAAQEIKDRTAFFASWEWKYGRPIPFSQEIKARFAWGDVQLRLDVQAGEVRRAALFSDSLEQSLLEACGSALEGCRYDSDAMTDAVHAAVSSMAGGKDLLDPAAASQIEKELTALIRQHVAG